MKEVKEVVHVPTRELAEKVLRVAKENGLYKDDDLESMLKQVKQDELCIRPGVDYGFASFGYFKDKEYKIITAQEFLSRYKETEVSELDQLRKENAELKKQLQAINDQPKVGDVCLFWDNRDNSFEVSNLKDIDNSSSFIYETTDGVWYENCIKATDENIQAKINELKND